jgi:hypothetical protein
MQVSVKFHNKILKKTRIHLISDFLLQQIHRGGKEDDFAIFD